MNTPDLPKTPLPTITVVPDGPNLIVVGTDQIAEAARHLDGIEGWNSSHPGEYEGLPCVRFLGARPSTGAPTPEPGKSLISDTPADFTLDEVVFWTDDEEPTTPAPAETTGAVERAADALHRERYGCPLAGQDADTCEVYHGEARAALAAALDVDEMARTLGEHEAQMLLPDGVAPDDYDGRDHWMCSCDHDYGVYDVGADADPAIRAHEAHVLRAALLGGEGA